MLRECIDSVLAQQGVGMIEILVHDDASTDESLALLHDAYPQIRLLPSPSNVGFCVANNRMVAQARGDFVLLLNNDAALLPGALQTLLDAARQRAAPAVFTLPQFDWRSGELVDRGCLLDPFYNPVPNLDPERSEVAMAIGACLFLPRALWHELGGFPEWMESIGEDMYLCCTARLRGHAVMALSSSGYRHRRGASFSGERSDANTLMSSFRRRRLSERNKTAALIVCTPTPLTWPLLMVHAILLAFEGIAMSATRWNLRIWREIYAPALAGTCLPSRALRQRRRGMQAMRLIGLRAYFHGFDWMPYKLRMLLRHGIPEVR